ncbi:MAG: DUF2853 family protein [bacterium]
MSDYVENVRKYRSNASEETIDKIVKHLGIALQSKDASLVACSDASELERVRESWCKKKLGSDKSDDELDAIINDVCVEMAEEKGNKSRVTFYYVVADKLNKLVTL